MLCEGMPDIDGTRHAAEADEHIRSVVHPVVHRHSRRVFLLGSHVASADGHADLDTEALLIAALFHDSGTADLYNGDARFEVEGADAAALFLDERGWTTRRIDLVWEAIALHTTPGIPERRSAIARYLRRGVEIDFGSDELRNRFTSVIAAAEALHPRGDIEMVLGDLVVEQALANPDKCPRPSWAADLVAHHLPGQRRINPAF
jgi:hypothetical protein